MKAMFIIYHDILEDRVDNVLNKAGVDYYTKWEEVKGKGHLSDAHFGTRTFPGYNHVRLIAFDDEKIMTGIIQSIKELNKESMRPDDKIRVFMMPLEMIV